MTDRKPLPYDFEDANKAKDLAQHLAYKLHNCGPWMIDGKERVREAKKIMKELQAAMRKLKKR